MLSRVAESIYWMSRYIERAENYARLIDVNLNLMLDAPPDMPEQWSPLVKTTGDFAQFQSQGEPLKEDVLQFLTFDTANPNSIVSCLEKARENAKSVREIISSEMWLHLNEFYLKVQAAPESGLFNPENPTVFFNEIKTGSHTFTGIMDSTQSRTEGWHFGNMGRFLERADKTARILDMKYFYLLPDASSVGTPIDLLQWSALLKSASAFEMYRKTHGRLEVANIVHFLILDRFFPRAILYCLCQAEVSLHSISGTEVWEFANPAEKKLGILRSELDYRDVDEIFQQSLHEYLDGMQQKFNDISGAVLDTFFKLT